MKHAYSSRKLNLALSVACYLNALLACRVQKTCGRSRGRDQRSEEADPRKDAGRRQAKEADNCQGGHCSYFELQSKILQTAD
jgi:hypothetical protein